MTWSAGTFSRTGGSTAWGDDRDAATEIEAGLHDTHDQDLAQGINDCLHKGGQNAATADISMGSNKLTNLATPTADNDAANKTYVDNSGPFGAAATGDEFLGRFATTPTGWTKSSVTNKAIRLNSGTPGADGGSNPFSTAFNSSRTTSNTTVTLNRIVDAVGGSGVNTTQSTNAHNHTLNLNVQYRDYSAFSKT